MDEFEKRELQRWAESFAGRGDSERRAMGKAILLLLMRIDALEAELAEAHADQPSADRQTRPTAEGLPSREGTDFDGEAPQDDSGNGGTSAPDPSSSRSPASAANRRVRERLRAASHRMLNR